MNKKHFILGMILLCLFRGGFSQSKQANENLRGWILYADSIRESEEVSHLISNLKQNVNHDSTSQSLNYYNLAICYSAKDLVDSSCYYLRLALDQSSYYNALIYTDTDFEELRDKPCWDTILKKIDNAFLSQYSESHNQELAIELYHIYLQDQHARGLGLKKMTKDLINIDSVNLKRVEEIINLYGWPTYSLVGETASKGAFLVIQHANVHIQQKYLKLLFDAAMNNEASKEWVALLTDRISIMIKGIQIFGTQVYYVRDSMNMRDGIYRYFPIKDEAQVDSLRKAFEMIPLKEYYARYGIDYKPLQK